MPWPNLTWRDILSVDTSPTFVMGVDLGELADFTAVSLLERHDAPPRPIYDVRHLERIPLKTKYPEVVRLVRDGIEAIMEQRPRPRLTLGLDGTGVGVAITDLFEEADLGVPIVPITIHGGQSVVRDGTVYRVPKKDLVGELTVLFQNGQLRIAEGNPDTKAMVQELTTFKRSFTKLGHETFGADSPWRETAHDDLILATAIAAWVAEHAAGLDFAPLDDDVINFFRRHGFAPAN